MFERSLDTFCSFVWCVGGCVGVGVEGWLVGGGALLRYQLSLLRKFGC